jgi:diaminopimelate decarboxylase
MDVVDLLVARREASSCGGVINGLHVYVGTNFQSADEMLPTLRAFFNMALSIPELEYVNIGGGVGVDYTRIGDQFNLLKFGSEVSKLTRRLAERMGRDVTLFFEPGRSLVASSGAFFTRVTDIKRLSGTTYVTVDASIAIFPRPFHHPDSPHRVQAVGRAHETKSLEEVTIVGRTTFSRDILAQCKLPSTIELGDLLVFEDAGAYCQSMISQFLGQGEPPYLIID